MKATKGKVHKFTVSNGPMGFATKCDQMGKRKKLVSGISHAKGWAGVTCKNCLRVAIDGYQETVQAGQLGGEMYARHNHVHE